jgi:hypothetical protein
MSIYKAFQPDMSSTGPPAVVNVQVARVLYMAPATAKDKPLPQPNDLAPMFRV